MADCSEKLTREHFISENVLRKINRAGDGGITGFLWLGGRELRLPPNAVASKILCDRHNEALAPLDAEAGSLFERLERPPRSVEPVGAVSGENIERWLLKLLVGGLFSRWATLDDLPLDGWTPPLPWLRRLFSRNSEFSAPAGLYAVRQTRIGRRGVEFAAVASKSANAVIGVSARINSVKLSLMVEAPQDPPDSFLGGPAYRRPTYVQLDHHSSDKRSAHLYFAWT